MAFDLFLFVLGVALVYKGSDYFVDASIGIGERAQLPRVVIGGTLVSLATTTPELMISILAGVEQAPGLAIGNALGSVAFNTGFILAIAAIIRSFELPHGEFRWRSWVMLGMAVILFIMTLDLSLPRWRGLILVGSGIAYLFVDFSRGRKRYNSSLISDTLAVKFQSTHRLTLFFLLGAAMTVLGSQLLVSSGVAIAQAIGAPRVFVGLTMVAVGTSLPELVTAITSVRKKVFDLSAGNLIGANVLNLTIVTGAAASISPLQLVRTNQIYTFPAILVILAVFFLAARSRNRLTRSDGVLLVALYVGFVAGLSILNL